MEIQSTSEELIPGLVQSRCTDADLIENCILESERVLTTLTHEFEDQSHFHINQPFPASFLTGPFFTIDDDRIPNLSKMIRFLHDEFSCPHDISLMNAIVRKYEKDEYIRPHKDKNYFDEAVIGIVLKSDPSGQGLRFENPNDGRVVDLEEASGACFRFQGEARHKWLHGFKNTTGHDRISLTLRFYRPDDAGRLKSLTFLAENGYCPTLRAGVKVREDWVVVVLQMEVLSRFRKSWRRFLHKVNDRNESKRVTLYLGETALDEHGAFDVLLQHAKTSADPVATLVMGE